MARKKKPQLEQKQRQVPKQVLQAAKVKGVSIPKPRPRRPTPPSADVQDCKKTVTTQVESSTSSDYSSAAVDESTSNPGPTGLAIIHNMYNVLEVEGEGVVEEPDAEIGVSTGAAERPVFGQQIAVEGGVSSEDAESTTSGTETASRDSEAASGTKKRKKTKKVTKESETTNNDDAQTRGQRKQLTEPDTTLWDRWANARTGKIRRANAKLLAIALDELHAQKACAAARASKLLGAFTTMWRNFNNRNSDKVARSTFFLKRLTSLKYLSNQYKEKLVADDVEGQKVREEYVPLCDNGFFRYLRELCGGESGFDERYHLRVLRTFQRASKTPLSYVQGLPGLEGDVEWSMSLHDRQMINGFFCRTRSSNKNRKKYARFKYLRKFVGYATKCRDAVVVTVGQERLRRIDGPMCVAVTDHITRWYREHDWRDADIAKIAPITMLLVLTPTEAEAATYSSCPLDFIDQYRKLHGMGVLTGN